MTNAYIGEIILFAGNFNPRSWARCDGQLLAISQYSALFSLLGTTYGGDGRSTFALPDMRGRVATGVGTGPGLSTRQQGSRSGSETHTLNINEIPAHTHTQRGSSKPPTQNTASGASLASGDITTPMENIYAASNGDVPLSATGLAGGSQSHTNLQPILAVNFIICLQGIFPSRN
ncbi:Microcystin-dependent protein [Spirosomataceae bacterium TFI 002]|nr:Microcystin-dependent protein [Spirosomataceae bacterium TFI 002]